MTSTAAKLIEALPYLMRYARRLCRDDIEAANDLSGETALRALECQTRFDEAKGDFITWVTVIMKNLFITTYNHNRHMFAYRDSVKADRGRETAQIAPFSSLDLSTIVRECRREEVVLFARGYSVREIAVAEGVLEATLTYSHAL